MDKIYQLLDLRLSTRGRTVIPEKGKFVRGVPLFLWFSAWDKFPAVVQRVRIQENTVILAKLKKLIFKYEAPEEAELYKTGHQRDRSPAFSGTGVPREFLTEFWRHRYHIRLHIVTRSAKLYWNSGLINVEKPH